METSPSYVISTRCVHGADLIGASAQILISGSFLVREGSTFGAVYLLCLQYLLQADIYLPSCLDVFFTDNSQAATWSGSLYKSSQRIMEVTV